MYSCARNSPCVWPGCVWPASSVKRIFAAYARSSIQPSRMLPSLAKASVPPVGGSPVDQIIGQLDRPCSKAVTSFEPMRM
eukprot:scaffold649974_cov46-Prasinocladus_malaysianus.AAC.1